MSHEAQTRLPWTAEEDAILISLVERYGEKRWNMVANGLPGRTGKGCSHRWRTYLRPDVKHPHLEPFTEWEAAVIVQAQREMGNNWLAIAKLLLPGRSNTAVKNFWHCRLKSGSGTNANRFIVEGYGLRFLLNEVPHDERIHPVALPAFPSTAPTGQLHHPKSHHQHQQQQQQLHQHYHYEQPMMDLQMAGMGHMATADGMMVAAAADHQALAAAAAAAAQAYGHVALDPTTAAAAAAVAAANAEVAAAAAAAGGSSNGGMIESAPDAAAASAAIDTAAAASANEAVADLPVDTAAAAAVANPADATAAAAAAAAQQAPADPNIDPKEDMRRRASAYVQQQLALMGQPSPRHANGNNSSSQAAASSYRRGSLTHTAVTQSCSHVNNNCLGGSTATHMGWHGAAAVSGGGCSAQMGSAAFSSWGIQGPKRGSGRGRGRRPRVRYSCDDPYDETYVPAGMSREEELARCSNHSTQNRVPVATSSSQFASSSPVVMHGSSSSSAMAATMGNNCVGAHVQPSMLQHASMVGYQGIGVVDAAAAAAMPAPLPNSNCSQMQSAAVPAGYEPMQHSYTAAAAAAAGTGNSGTAAAAAAELGKMPWGAAAGYRMSLGGYGLCGYDHPAAAAAAGADSAAGGAAAANAAMYGAAAAALPNSAAAAGAAGYAINSHRQKPGTDGRLLAALDDDITDFETFRQSGVDFKVSLSSLDELLSGQGPAGSGSGADWAGLGAVAGLFRGTSLDGSRFSLTGSADGFGSRRSSRGVVLNSMPRLSQQQLLQLRASQQQQQLEHLLMPPPRHHHAAAGHHLGIPGVVNVAAWDAVGQPCSSTMHESNDRSESPFKAAAVQKAPFSPAIGSAAGAAAAGAPSVAPSSQATHCSFSVQVSEQGSPDIKQSSQQQQGSPEKLASASQQQQRLPATFHDVLQALQLPAKQQQQQEILGASQPEQQAPSSSAEQPVSQHAADAAAAVETAGPVSQPVVQPTPAAMAPPAAINSLRVHCPTNAEQQQQQRASAQLLSPVGRLFANRGSMDGCLLLEDPMGICGFDLSTAVDDSAQTRAERRSLRLLLGALASSDPLHSSWDPAANCSTTAAAAAAGSGGQTAAADPAAAAAAEELRAIKRESEGQGNSSRRNTSSSRLSNGSLMSGGYGLSVSGRTSSRGLSSWFGTPGQGASGTAASAAVAEREAALFRRQGRVSGSILAAVGGDLHKWPRVSLTLTSPRNGAGAKRHRVSYMGSLAVGRPSADGADVDDCLSFWKV